MAKNSKKKQTSITQINSDLELANAVSEFGETLRAQAKLEIRINNRINLLKKLLAEFSEPFKEKITSLTQGIYIYAEKNRDKLLVGDSKTVTLTSGTLQWKEGKPSVKAKTTDTLIGEILNRNNMNELHENNIKIYGDVFLRINLELNKEKVLENPTRAKAVTDISVDQGGERFYIKPSDIDTEIAVN